MAWWSAAGARIYVKKRSTTGSDVGRILLHSSDQTPFATDQELTIAHNSNIARLSRDNPDKDFRRCHTPKLNENPGRRLFERDISSIQSLAAAACDAVYPYLLPFLVDR